MGCNQLADDDPTGFELCKRAGFVTCLWPTVAGNVNGEDRRKLSFDGMNGHARLLPLRV
jgi:hypothetical protein